MKNCWGTARRAQCQLMTHRCRSIRLKEYNYCQPGAYFVTVCAHHQECAFGDVIDGNMHLNECGQLVGREWLKTFDIRKNLLLDQYIVMPNHFHGIIVMTAGRGTLQRAPALEQFGKPVSNSLPTIIRLFKSTTTKQINEWRKTPGMCLWQRNYYEHIIRNEDELNRVREYVANNPLQWEFDTENPNGRGTLQRAPTKKQWGYLEEKICGKAQENNSPKSMRGTSFPSLHGRQRN